MSKLKIILALSLCMLLILTARLLYEEGDLRQILPEKSIHTESHALAASYEIIAKRDLLALMMAYPEQIKSLEKESDGRIFVIMQSGNKIVYDDMRTKSFEGKLADADLQDMMEQVYPLADITAIVEDHYDPGRIRDYEFLNAVYGSTKGNIEKNLTNIPLGSGNFSFNKNNDAASALKAAFQEIASLIKTKSSIYGFVFPVNGTYNYRFIAGTNQLSPHSFGIAIDLKSNPNDYWRWVSKKQGQSRLDSYPKELVRAFENHFFIWGGKWSHFDFLHFEYRPELIIKSKYYMDPNTMNGPWYEGYPDDPLTQNYINVIEST